MYLFLLCGLTSSLMFFFFFFNDTATTEIYTLSLHDALPISCSTYSKNAMPQLTRMATISGLVRSEEHTSELQSHSDLVCRLLLEKKKKKKRKQSRKGITKNERHLQRKGQCRSTGDASQYEAN